MRASISSLVEEGPSVATIFVFRNITVFCLFLNTDLVANYHCDLTFSYERSAAGSNP
jgi:hypothetical protein